MSEAKKFIRFWHPDGCIVNNDRLPPEIFRGIPTLFLHRPPEGLPETGAAHLSFDEAANGELAARELLDLDLASYAYVQDPGEYWSAEREETARPTISSIAFDYAECNTCACSALNALMQRPGQRCRKIKIKPDRLVRRGSTMRLRRADKTVIAARDLIRTRACSGLAVGIAAQCGYAAWSSIHRLLHARQAGKLEP